MSDLGAASKGYLQLSFLIIHVFYQFLFFTKERYHSDDSDHKSSSLQSYGIKSALLNNIFQIFLQSVNISWLKIEFPNFSLTIS